MTDLETVPPVFSDYSAQDTSLAVEETREWIEAVTGRTFSVPFRESLEDGVLLCELMQKIRPGSIRRINKSPSPIAHLDNIQQFLSVCQELGLNNAQLFDCMDLQEPKGTKTGAKMTEAERRIRNVCITLYWLGRIVSELEGYTGPQLDLSAFGSMVAPMGYSPPQLSYSDEDSSFDQGFSSEPGLSGEQGENGFGLTFEQERTADQLLADIQSAVDEMLQDFQLNMPSENAVKQTNNIPPQPMPVTNHVPHPHTESQPPKPSRAPPPPKPKPPTRPSKEGTRLGVSVHMNSRSGSFGFQVYGGTDIGCTPQVEVVIPGSAAEESGVKPGDELISVNKQDISQLTHLELVRTIRKAAREGSIVLGLVRTMQVPTPTVQEVVIQPTMPERVSPPVTKPSRVSPPVTQPSRVSPPVTQPSRVSPPVTQPSRVSPPVTQPSRVSPPVTQPSRVSPPVTQPSRVSPPVTQPSRVSPPATQPSRVSPPAMPERVSPTSSSSHHPAFSRRESEIMWEEEQRERERQAQEIAMLYPHSPSDHFKQDGGLPPLIEEAVMATTDDILERQPLPILTKTSPSPPAPLQQEEGGSPRPLETPESESSESSEFQPTNIEEETPQGSPEPLPLEDHQHLNGPISSPSPPAPAKVIEELAAMVTQAIDEAVPVVQETVQVPPKEVIPVSQHKKVVPVPQPTEVIAVSQPREVVPELQPETPPPSRQEPEEETRTVEPETPTIVKIVTPEPVVEGIKISNVQRTRWTPSHSYQNGSPHWTQQINRDIPRPYEVARSYTWGAREKPRVPATSPQKAYAVRASDSRALCSRCSQPLGSAPIMAVPQLRLQFHVRCFTCHVCRVPLAAAAQNASILVQSNQPHCQYCCSNKQGLLFTEC